MKILVIFATQNEVFDIRFKHHEVVTILSGVGKARSAMMVMKGIIEHQPDIVVSVGTAGTFTHQVGDILVCRHFIDRDFYKVYDSLQLECDITVPEDPFIQKFHSILSGKPIGRTDFTDSCGDNFVTAGNSLGADVVDMESFAELQACKEMGVPFFAVKYITDIIGQNSLEIWETRLADARKNMSAYFKSLNL